VLFGLSIMQNENVGVVWFLNYAKRGILHDVQGVHRRLHVGRGYTFRVFDVSTTSVLSSVLQPHIK